MRGSNEPSSSRAASISKEERDGSNNESRQGQGQASRSRTAGARPPMFENRIVRDRHSGKLMEIDMNPELPHRRGWGRSYVFTKGEEVAAHHEAVLDAPGHLRTGRRLRRGERPESDEVGMTPMPTTTLRPRLPVSSPSDSTAIGGMTHQIDLPRGHGSHQRIDGNDDPVDV